MQLSDLDYQYPTELIALKPQEPCRILVAPTSDSPAPAEIDKTKLFQMFRPGDVLVINDTHVEKRRVFSAEGLEILFLECDSSDPTIWSVLFPARDVKDDQLIGLPGQVTAQLVARGIPQKLKLNQKLPVDYFSKYGELALPPYIQKARGTRHSTSDDSEWYQTQWSQASKLEFSGSVAAPTASLHFSADDLGVLASQGVKVKKLTLHVGIGTFLPVKVNNLEDHKMHHEWASIPFDTADAIEAAHREGQRIWALGTTATRSVESLGQGLLAKDQASAAYWGTTDLFIRPGYQWKYVTGLLTNFHQPKSTLLALVASFSGLDTQRLVYKYAIENKFRLFSYGDLSVWLR